MDFELRDIRMTDLDDLLLYANNPLIAQNLTDRFPHPYTESHGKNFIESAMVDDPRRVKVISVNDRLIGCIGIHPQVDIMRKNAELGYWLAQPYWGKNIMTNAILKMVEYGFDTFDINRIFARPFGPNIASQKVLEKAGFTLEAKLEKTIFKNDEFLDELIYAIRK